ncbi:MAG: glycosyltransferase family 4 protein [Archangium sp.]|nr:glycosyltransferase family 4 protein [Archangium sp.]
MRLLFLGVHARDRSPSQRYRFEAFEPHLKTRGIEVTYAGALTTDEARDFYGPVSPLRKGRIAARALVRRAASLLHRPDVVFVQREAFFLLNHWSEWLAHLRAPVVFDFDDAIWIHAVSEANRRFAFLKNVEKIPRVVGLSHTVIAGNEYLATWARQHSRNVQVIPTCVDTDRFAPLSNRADSVVTIGWSGSPSTVAHLRPLLPALERVKARYQDRVRLRVMGDPTFSHAPLGLQGEAWSAEAELELLRRMDIGLMPLPDDAWTRGKCGLKGLVSMSMGAATVMSPVGVNTEIVKHGENGLLARTDDEWVEALSRLIDDAALRQRIGAAGRATVVERYSVQRWQEPLAALLLDAAR